MFGFQNFYCIDQRLQNTCIIVDTGLVGSVGVSLLDERLFSYSQGVCLGKQKDSSRDSEPPRDGELE